MNYKIVLPAVFAAATGPLAAQLVGTETFTYANGNVANLAGGTGFNYDNFDKAVTTFSSDWDSVFGTPTITGNALTTNNSGAKREYNGTVEGAGGGANDGQDNHERSGAVRGVGRVFYRFTLTRGTGVTWSGASSYDFGTERVFFGVPGGNGPLGVLQFGVSGNGNNYFTSTPADTATHTIVTVLDFDKHFIGMWLDPTSADYYDPADGSNSTDAGGAYTPTNWSTAVRLGSSAGGTTTWDDLNVALDPTSVGLKNYTDADNDGLPASFETLYGLNDNDDGTAGETSPGQKNGPNGAGGDFDGDTVTNLTEFQDGSFPNNTDSDADLLLDGEEKTAGTSPLKPDTDGDALTDKQEVSVSLTNPLSADSDSGGTSDFTELALGKLPNGTPGDDPLTNGNMELIGLDFFDSYTDGQLGGGAQGLGWDYDNAALGETFTGHSTLKSAWANVGNTPTIQSGMLITQESSIKRTFHGGSAAATGVVVGEKAGAFRYDAGSLSNTNGSDLLYVKVNVVRQTGASWSGVSLYDFGAEKIFLGVPSAANPNSGNLEFGIQQSTGAVLAYSGIAPTVGTAYTVVGRFDFANSKVDLYVNPDLALPEASSTVRATLNITPAQMNATGIRLGSGGTGATNWDQLVLGTTWDSLDSLPSDSDGDGMPDEFEDLYGFNKNVNDANLDADNDGSSNVAEYRAATNPTLEDTDGDGLSDGTGESAAHTLPLNPDTDGDGLQDGAEVGQTDPTDNDSDNDGQSDGGEVVGFSGFTSDPNDPNDTIGAPLGLIGREDFSSYADGSVIGLSGGTYFDYENWLLNGPFVGHTNSTSDWDGTANIAGGHLATRENYAYREFYGPGEAAGSNQAPTEARMGAVNDEASHDASVVYFKATMTRRTGALLSSFGPDDFNQERLAFGIVDNGGVPQWGIREGAAITADNGSLAVNPDQSYTVVGKLDFTGNLLSLWIDPNLTGSEASNTPHLTRLYGGTNWASGVRFSSTGTGDTEWDNVVVANTWERLAEDISPVHLSVTSYNAGTGTLGINTTGIPDGKTYRLLKSPTLQGFVPLVPPFTFDSTTPQPFAIPVDPVAVPKLFFRAEEIPSP